MVMVKMVNFKKMRNVHFVHSQQSNCQLTLKISFADPCIKLVLSVCKGLSQHFVSTYKSRDCFVYIHGTDIVVGKTGQAIGTSQQHEFVVYKNLLLFESTT